MTGKLSSITTNLKEKFNTYIQELLQIWSNVTLLYRNFIHWNISKLCIFLYANIAGFILSIPFIAIIVVQYFQSYSSLLGGVDIYSFLGQNFGTILLTILLLVIIAAIFIATYTYGYFLLLNVYKGYLNNEKLPYTENLYFSLKHFWVYLGILGWTGLYLLMPILTLLILAIPFGIAIRMDIFGSILSFFNGNVLIGAISMIVFAIIAFWFFNLYIRLFFTSFELLYSEKIERSKIYIKQSLDRTKGRVWKIIFLAIPFILALGIISSILGYGESSLMVNRAHTALSAEQSREHKSDHILIEQYFDGNESEREEFEKIQARYQPLENSINREFLTAVIDYIDIKRLDPNWWIFTTVFVVVSYVLFEGIGSMIYLSIWRILRKEQETV